MSLYVLMRLLESAPRRYELGIRLLSLGRLERIYDQLVAPIQPGARVLDLGCGTGLLTIRAARRGARVKGIDINPQMLEIAEEHVRQCGLQDQVTLAETGVAELDAEQAGCYDVVTCGLLLSELGDAELRYTLRQIHRLLRAAGLLLIVDEVRPATRVGRILHGLIRLPLAVLTALLAQQPVSRPVADLPRRLKEAGFEIEAWRPHYPGILVQITARKVEAGL